MKYSLTLLVITQVAFVLMKIFDIWNISWIEAFLPLLFAIVFVFTVVTTELLIDLVIELFKKFKK